MLTQSVPVQYAAIFDMESWLYLDGLHGIETVAIIFGSGFPPLWRCWSHAPLPSVPEHRQ